MFAMAAGQNPVGVSSALKSPMPSLREHKDDIRDIADNWWFDRFRKHLSDAQISALKSYNYPGNVRELLNLLERAAVLGESDFALLLEKHREMNAGLFDNAPPEEPDVVPDELDEAIRRHIQKVFNKYAQNLSRASTALKISRTTLRKYIQ